MPIDDFLLAGALAALFEQFDGVFAYGFQRNASSDSGVAADFILWLGRYRTLASTNPNRWTR